MDNFTLNNNNPEIEFDLNSEESYLLLKSVCVIPNKDYINQSEDLITKFELTAEFKYIVYDDPEGRYVDDITKELPIQFSIDLNQLQPFVDLNELIQNETIIFGRYPKGKPYQKLKLKLNDFDGLNNDYSLQFYIEKFKINDSVDRLIKNYCNARRSWEVWCYLSGFDNDFNISKKEVRQTVDVNPLFFHLRYLSMKDYYIELYKIVKESQNNKDNLYNLLQKRIKSNPKNIVEIESALNGLFEIWDTIKYVCDIRDKFYTHLDKDFKEYTASKINILSTNKLFEKIEKGIISLTSLEELNENLNQINSREDYDIYFKG